MASVPAEALGQLGRGELIYGVAKAGGQAVASVEKVRQGLHRIGRTQTGRSAFSGCPLAGSGGAICRASEARCPWYL